MYIAQWISQTEHTCVTSIQINKKSTTSIQSIPCSCFLSGVSIFEGKKSDVGTNVGAPDIHLSFISFICKMSGTIRWKTALLNVISSMQTCFKLQQAAQINCIILSVPTKYLWQSSPWENDQTWLHPRGRGSVVREGQQAAFQQTSESLITLVDLPDAESGP